MTSKCTIVYDKNRLIVFHCPTKSLDLSSYTGAIEIECNKLGIDNLILPQNGNLRFVNCSVNNLRDLKVPYGVEYLFCDDNQLDRLELPHTIQAVHCCRNNLRHLVLPEGTRNVSCSGNRLERLVLPKSVINVNCSCNKIRSLKIVPGLRKLYCDCNRIKRLNMLDNLIELSCSRNHLRSLTVPIGMQKLWCDSNQLTQLEIPIGNLKTLWCKKNELTELRIYHPIEHVHCDSNKQLLHLEVFQVTDLTCDGCPVVFDSYTSRRTFGKLTYLRKRMRLYYASNPTARLMDAYINKGQYRRVLRIQKFLHDIYWNPSNIFAKRRIRQLCADYQNNGL